MKKKKKAGLGTLMPVFVGAAYGFFMIEYFYTVRNGALFGDFCVMMLGLILGLFVQVIVHELGHLVFGLATGYKFLSFRVGSLTLIKDAEKFKFAKIKVAGTAGQCLLSPPQPDKEGKIPYVLYNLGGVIFNAAAFVIFLPFAIVFFFRPIVFSIFAGQAFSALMSAIMNGLPMTAGGVDNDGKNIKAIASSPVAMRAFWVQMKVAENLSKGVGVLEMDEKLFEMPEKSDINCGLMQSVVSFACSRLLAEGKFLEASEKIAEFLSDEVGMYGICKNMLACDLIYCKLMLGETESAVALCDYDQNLFMKKMATNISVLRTCYAYALLASGDPKGAEKHLAQFEKFAKIYPYFSEVTVERGLVRFAKQKFDEREKHISEQEWYVSTENDGELTNGLAEKSGEFTDCEK